MSIKYSNDSSKAERLAKARAAQEAVIKTVAEPVSAPVEPISVPVPTSSRGRPVSSASNETVRPWEAEGISRNTWYVRQRIKREREEAARIAAEEAVKLAKVRPVAKPVPEDDTW